jgi:hypothetical protein
MPTSIQGHIPWIDVHCPSCVDDENIVRSILKNRLFCIEDSLNEQEVEKDGFTYKSDLVKN